MVTNCTFTRKGSADVLTTFKIHDTLILILQYAKEEKYSVKMFGLFKFFSIIKKAIPFSEY